MPPERCGTCGINAVVSGRCYNVKCEAHVPEYVPLGVKEEAAAIRLVEREVVELVEGEPCPTCGRKVTKSGAVRQREYRERKKS